MGYWKFKHQSDIPILVLIRFHFSEIMFKVSDHVHSKAQIDLKAEHTRQYVSILIRFGTRLLGVIRGFEHNYRCNLIICAY